MKTKSILFIFAIMAAIIGGCGGSDTEDSCQCAANAACDDTGACVCKDGFEGDDPQNTACTAKEDPDPCDDVSCADKASCKNGTCVCDDGYESDDPATTDCEESENPDPCKDVTCADKAECDNGTCVCEDGYESDDPATDDCTEIVTDLCEEVTCATNASCDAADGTCKCDEGFEGDDPANTDCTAVVVDPCAGACDAITNSHCDDSGAAPVCACDDGFHGDADPITTCTDNCDGVDCSGIANSVCDNTTNPGLCLCDDTTHEELHTCEDLCDGNTCTTDDANSMCDYMTGDCVCNYGYHYDDNDDCVVDVDPCAAEHSDTGCIAGTEYCDTTATTAVCACSPGYELVSEVCTLIECDTACDYTTDHKVCDNTTDPAAPVCVCAYGYNDTETAGTCVEDADPCADVTCEGDNWGCVAGECVCGNATVDVMSCDPIDACDNACDAIDNSTCDETATPAVCVCDAGFKADATPLTTCDYACDTECSDIDNSACNTTDPAVPVCECATDYEEINTCTDLCDANTCATDDANSMCDYLTGGCVCNYGYHYDDNNTCVIDVDPCAAEHSDTGCIATTEYCDTTATTAVCACSPGYELLSEVCTLIECATACEATTEFCDNITDPANPACVCAAGYYDDNGTCTLICAALNSGAGCDDTEHKVCNDDATAAACVCKPGYNDTETAGTCVEDVDPCDSKTCSADNSVCVAGECVCDAASGYVNVTTCEATSTR